MKILLTSLLFLAMLVPAQSQNDDKKGGKKASKLMTFIEEHFPERHAELEKILEEDGKKAQREALRDDRETFQMYQEILEFDGEDLAEQFIDFTKKTKKVETIIAKLEDAEGDEKAELRGELEDIAVEITKMELESLEEEEEMIKEELEMIAEEKEELVELSKDPEAAADYLIEMMAEMAEMDFEEGEEEVGKTPLPEDWHTDLDDAKAAAKESGKPIHVVFSTSWCGPCQAMVKGVYPKEHVQKALEAYEALYVDGDKFPQVCKDYNVRGFPTFLMIDAEGEVTNTCRAGGMGADRFIQWLEEKK